MTNAILTERPSAGNPHGWFDEEGFASYPPTAGRSEVVAKPRRGAFLHRKPLLCTVGALAVVACSFAADWPGVGKFVANDVSDFVNMDDPTVPFFLGEGMLLYTGPTALSTVPMNMGVATSGANTINVQDPATTLTLAGPVNQVQHGNFIKTGPGTLALTYPGKQTFALGPEADSLDSTPPIAWDETTGAASGGYGGFTVDQGDVFMGAPGQENTINVGRIYVGTPNQHKARLVVTNGVLNHVGTWLAVAMGCGKTTNDSGAELYVGKDAKVSVKQCTVANPG